MSFWDSTEDSLGSIYPPKHDTLLEKRSFADTKPSARLTSIACPEQEDVGSEALSLSYQFHDTDDIFKIEDDGKPGDVLRVCIGFIIYTSNGYIGTWYLVEYIGRFKLTLC